MKDTLPDRPRPIECGVVNLDAAEGTGTHWVCYAKTKDKRRIYFDSFGQNVLIMKYLKPTRNLKIKYPSSHEIRISYKVLILTYADIYAYSCLHS